MIPVAVPNLTGNEKKYLCDCIDTTFVSSVGEFVNKFEDMVAKSTRSQYAVATSAGTTGIHTALTAAGVKRDELVIVPTFTFVVTANAIRHCGADPWLMDMSADDWCLDPAKVREEIKNNCEQNGRKLIHKPTGKRVAALMPVYTIGNIPDMDAFRRLADEYKIPLIVDAAYAMGATYKGRPLGGLADASVISFNGNRTVTCGGGGVIVGNNKDLLGHARHLSTNARVWPDYDFDEVGFNYRMTNIQAALGCAQMERLEEFVASKRKTREYYATKLDGLKSKGISFFPSTDGCSCWYSGIVLPEGSTWQDSKDFCRKMKEKDIEAKTFWKPVHIQPPYRDALCADVSVADNIWQRIIALPCSSGITDEELETVTNAIGAIL